MEVAIIGAGGLGREVKSLIDDINSVSSTTIRLLGYYDDAFEIGYEVIEGVKCLGNISALKERKNKLGIVFGLGDPIIKNRILKKIQGNSVLYFPNIIHPNVKIPSDTVIGEGNLITYGCFMSCNVKIGSFNFFNTYCAVGHDAIIGDKNIFMPRVQISGDVLIGNSNFWGMSSSIIQGKRVGDENTINGYTFLTKNISNKRTYFGVPGKRIK